MSQRIWNDIYKGFGARGIIGILLEFIIKGPEQPLSFAEPEGPSEEPSPYAYTPLPEVLDGTCIRLMELFPGRGKDRIVCRLASHRLDDCRGRYEALSYVWGDTSDTWPVYVDDMSFSVGANLYQALSDLRAADKARMLWIDAVCIDQANIAERNKQVSVMADIYRGAARTLIYLGPAYPMATPLAYDMVERLAAEALEVGGTQEPFTLSSLDQSASVRSRLSSHDISLLDVSNIRHIAEADWWARAWTAQEILLATQATIMTGVHAIEWDRFCAGVDYGLRTGIIDAVNGGIVVDPCVLPYLTTHTLRREAHALSEPGATCTAASAKRLLALLVHGRSRQAIDPRDKIYAYLGMMTLSHTNAGSLGIMPDYAAEDIDIYTHTAQSIIAHSGCLDALGACMLDTSVPLPSWVPDWSNTDPVPRPLMYDTLGGRRLTHACPLNTQPPVFADDGTSLILSGKRITSIESLSPVLPRPFFEGEGNWLLGFLSEKLGNSRLATVVKLFLFLPILLIQISSIYRSFLVIVTQLNILAQLDIFASEVLPLNPVSSPDDDKKDDPLYVYWRTHSAGAGSRQRQCASALLRVAG